MPHTRPTYVNAHKRVRATDGFKALGKLSGSTKGFIVVVFLVPFATGYYLYLVNRPRAEAENKVTLTAAQIVLSRDLVTDYPPTPREVVRFYGDITKAFYDPDTSEEQLELLATKSRFLFDEKLRGQQTDSEYLSALAHEVALYAAGGKIISAFETTSSTNVFYFKKDGYDCAKLSCLISTRDKDKQIERTNEIFVLRKDKDKRWKIYGWEISGYQP